jgi:hypothetical protein
MTRLRRAGLWFGFVVIGVLCVFGCRPNRGAGSPDAMALEIAEADRTLQGTWLLLEAQPKPALDPVLNALLAVQFGQMKVTFQRGVMTAQGVGLQFKRSYQITSVEENGHMHMMLRDFVGDTDETDGKIDGDILIFNGRSSPWNGTGRLRRIGP